ncbi:type II toxin-antitoxin system VapC family toxin [Caviibacterium pharyngocola]|uniref:VapC toxin family PIN domain ribonuclease n=1 Tax=Caviibacterium pharyngocola TaxID=28159 RepID=A0A2M8RVW5_9PAST|nr:type II toxin-antitoxin system VapC family toxin [Caviibacterium pharyngocola]PJG83030.1 VapC toxin family PIN domain ribonuclease [Caviibacterium pharyngocola]
MYLFDTNVISETRKILLGKANQGVVDWLASINKEDIYTNFVVFMELERGILSMERRDIEQGKRLRNWFEITVIPSFKNKIFSIDAETAKICAKLHIPDRSPENDAWIAATAIQHNLTLVTPNAADFERLGVKLFNPFQ